MSNRSPSLPTKRKGRNGFSRRRAWISSPVYIGLPPVYGECSYTSIASLLLPFQRHLHVLFLAVAFDGQRHRVADLVRIKRRVEVADLLHRLAVHRRNQVAESHVA